VSIDIAKYGDMAWKWLLKSKVHREIAVSNSSNLNHSWERGLNEHRNGLSRQFFPKQTNFRIVKPEALEKAVMLINNRPRKSLDYKTPVEVL
jgi:IS30 family transposase